MWCQQSPDVLQNATLAALVCSAPPDDPSACVAICPNADLAGVGVRTAFYLQSVMNTLLVILSRRDSVPSTWASTLLTASLVIAAMVQKGNQSITLHHATLTMNFATLSCISSLAVAPTLSIWRLSPESYYTRQLARHVLNSWNDERSPPVISDKDRVRIQKAQSTQRLFLAVALLTQVVLQWAWGVVLFVSPVYSQTNCSGDTKLVFFLATFTAREVNNRYMVVWVFWLLFSLGITLAMTIILALTSPTRARVATASNSSRSSSLATRSSSLVSSAQHTVLGSATQFVQAVRNAIPARKDRAGQRVFLYNILAVFLWLLYFISAELQIQANCIFDGENVISGFGQITALLLALQPLWSVTLAIYRWPATRRRLERRRRREEQMQQQALDNTKPFLSVSTSATPLQIALPISGSAAVASSPVRGRSRSVLVVPEQAAPAVPIFATPQSERRVPAHASTGMALRPRGVATHTLDHIYIPRTSTEEWNELVSLTHLPRAPARS
ncbi:hypothetical protein C8Q77DRAFT_1064531 [Trametes polyzona]|nr:hypothetical protein C8Q77DRAFT_1064531 [Trametes polyzona]